MNKVVINNCYGGFGLSNEAWDWMIERGLDKEYYNENPNYNPEGRIFDGYKYYPSYEPELPRHHPLLVQCVEELGDKASGFCAKLCIEEIPGNQYRINEYDGVESIETPEWGWDWITIE